MPNDAAIRTIPDRLPKVRGPRMVLLHQRRDPLGSLPGEPLFDLTHQRTGNSSPPIAWMNSQPVDVASPAVERPDDRTDELPIGLGYKDTGLAAGDDSSEAVRVARHPGRGLRLSPQSEHKYYLLRTALTSGKAGQPQIAHRSPLINATMPP